MPLILATTPVSAHSPFEVDAAAAGLLSAGRVLELEVAGRGETARDAVAVSLNLTVTGAAGEGYATVYPCGSPRPEASTINFEVGSTIANGIVAKVGADGDVCIYTSVDADVVVDVDGYLPAESDYRPVTPARLLDTRPEHSTIDGLGAGLGERPAGSILELDVVGRGGIPADAAAVVLNLTTTRSAHVGFATLFPCGSARPNASTINFDRGRTVANSVVVGVGDLGRVCIYTSAATHVLADVAGSFPSGAAYRALTPARLLDTRLGHRTADGRAAGTDRLAAGEVFELDVAGRGGTSSDASAVSLNLTATAPRGAGYLTVFPCGSARPEASTINYARGATVANGVIAKLGDRGRVCIYSDAATHLVADVTGFFPPGRTYRPLTPVRLHDSRPPGPALPPLPASIDDHVARSLTLLNRLRVGSGLRPLTYDATMSAQATAWSRTMGRVGLRHSLLGYAENVAWHSRSAMSPYEAATTLHVNWTNSSGHFENMMNPRWTKIGIGFHLDDGGWWGTHVFDD